MHMIITGMLKKKSRQSFATELWIEPRQQYNDMIK